MYIFVYSFFFIKYTQYTPLGLIVLGLLRIVFIFIGLAVCSELPADEGVSMFRSYFAFFIMFTLDYARMWFKGASWYEKGLGILGSIYTLLQVALNWLATSRQLVLLKTETSYYIMSSSTFRMVPNFKFNLDHYMQWTAYITLGVAACELLIPSFNRYSLKKQSKALEKEVKEKVAWYRFWKRNSPETTKSIKPIMGKIGEGGNANEYH